MKIQYISSACVVIEHENVRVLCDPWLTDGIYYGSWYHYPPLTVGPEDFSDVDYIYITHIHPDHCDVESLKRLPKNIPLLIHDYAEKFLLRMLKGLGFENVIEIQHKSPFSLGKDFSIEVLAADNCDPAICGRWFRCHIGSNPTKTMQIDSLCVFSGGGKVLVNVNDCPFPISKTVCDYLVKKYPQIDFLLTGYSGAGPYPQCFKNLNEEQKLDAAEAKQMQFLNQAVSYLEALKPSYFLPFAGQYTLGGSLSLLNPYRGVPELEDLKTLFPPLLERSLIPSQMVLLNSMELFDLDKRLPSAPFTSIDTEGRRHYVKETLSKKKYLFEGFHLSKEAFSEMQERMGQAFQHMRSKLKFYEFSSPTAVYFDVGAEWIFFIPFNGEDFKLVKSSEITEPYVLIELHPGLLDMILKRQAHFNNAEIGSHLTFHRSPNIYERGIYNFLSYLN